MAESSPVIHRVTVEFLTHGSPVVHDFDDAGDAQRCIETAKQDREAWHIFHSIRQAPVARSVIALSLYRSHDTGEWRPEHHIFGKPNG